MSKTLEELEKDALNLPSEERAYLTDRLLGSLDHEALSDVDAAWVAEAERRYQAYKDGKGGSVSASEVFNDTEQKQVLRQEVDDRLEDLSKGRLRKVLDFVDALKSYDKVQEDPVLEVAGCLSGEPISSDDIESQLYPENGCK